MAERDTTPSDVPDVLAPGLGVVFCGINPGRVSAAARAHFANPRNDFWRLLHAARFTSRLYGPHEQFALLDEGVGVTNAAYRTTPGSGDLRRGDFAGSAERLERLARELGPGWLGFVGKEAYRGVFNERPELGLQERTLGETGLFVLPSTSPANAAVPWSERLRWFKELAGRSMGLPWREGVRALLVDPAGRTLLLRYGDDYGDWWVTPGGGKQPGESDEHALRRELREELGLRDVELGPLVWRREQWFRDEPGHCGQRENVYLVRVPAFDPAPEHDLADEGCHELRWVTATEAAALPTRPEDLAERLRRLIPE
ncbi:MAG TPA: NUDIX domain-containing protein [Gaiellaceae bacterium]|nr:NUDIX domain-containing protein [Gaiellaceae bacterium]